MSYLGVFTDETDAALFFDVAVVWLRGPLARLNFEERRAETIAQVSRYLSLGFTLAAAALVAGAARGAKETQGVLTAAGVGIGAEAGAGTGAGAVGGASSSRVASKKPLTAAAAAVAPKRRARTAPQRSLLATTVRGVVPDALVVPWQQLSTKTLLTTLRAPPRTFFASADGPGPRRSVVGQAPGAPLAALEAAAHAVLYPTAAATATAIATATAAATTAAAAAAAALDVIMHTDRVADVSMRSLQERAHRGGGGGGGEGDDTLMRSRSSLGSSVGDATMSSVRAMLGSTDATMYSEGGMSRSMALDGASMDVDDVDDDITFFTAAASGSLSCVGHGVFALAPTGGVGGMPGGPGPGTSRWSLGSPPVVPPSRVIIFSPPSGLRGGAARHVNQEIGRASFSRIDYYSSTVGGCGDCPCALAAAAANAGSSGECQASPHGLAGAAALVFLSASSESTLR